MHNALDSVIAGTFSTTFRRIKHFLGHEKWLTLNGDPISPVKHLTVTTNAAEVLSNEEVNRIFDRIITHCEDKGIAIVQSKKVPTDLTYNDRSLRLAFVSCSVNDFQNNCVKWFHKRRHHPVRLIPSSNNQRH